MRVVLDPNVIVSAVLSRSGAPARVLTAWTEGRFDLVVSGRLLEELERVLTYPKLRRRITPDDASALVSLLRTAVVLSPDPTREPDVRSADPGDDYLIALAAAERAALVSGDRHLLELAPRIPVLDVSAFLAVLEEAER